MVLSLVLGVLILWGGSTNAYSFGVNDDDETVPAAVADSIQEAVPDSVIVVEKRCSSKLRKKSRLLLHLW